MKITFYATHDVPTGSGFFQFPIQWIPEPVFIKIKQLEHEDDQLPLSSTKIVYTFTFVFTV